MKRLPLSSAARTIADYVVDFRGEIMVVTEGGRAGYVRINQGEDAADGHLRSSP